MKIDKYFLDNLLAYLKRFARGKENAILTHDLAARYFENPQKNDRRIRLACFELRNKRKERVFSASNGIFYTDDIKEMKAYQGRMRKKIAGDQESITATDHIIRDAEAEQDGLLFPVGAKGRIYD